MKTSFLQIKGVNGNIGNAIQIFDTDERLASWPNLANYLDPKTAIFTPAFSGVDRAGDDPYLTAASSNAVTETTINSKKAFSLANWKRMTSTGAVLKKTCTLAFVMQRAAAEITQANFMNLPFENGRMQFIPMITCRAGFAGTAYSMNAASAPAAGQNIVVMLSFNESEDKIKRICGTYTDEVTGAIAKFGAFKDELLLIGTNGASPEVKMSEIFIFNADLFKSENMYEKEDVLDYLRTTYNAV